MSSTESTTSETTASEPSASPRRCLVTGGGGFLGRAIVEALLSRGDQVTVLARGDYPELRAMGCRLVRADLGSDDDLAPHLAGVDVVFHAASKTGVWGSRGDFFYTNVGGVERLLSACRTAQIGRFVYTSSPSATFDGRDAEGATEADCPYPTHFEAPYPESKAVAEAMVLAANSPTLATVALRPHLIYGPRDPHIVPRLIARRRQGRLRRVGDGHNRVGITFVDNAAQAHLNAADRLQPGAACAGKAYFITDAEPVTLWSWIDELLVAVGEKPVSGAVSVGTAVTAGRLLQWIWGTFGLRGEPPMTPFVAKELASSHWYDLSGAARDLGYAPAVSGAEGFARTVAYFRAHPPA